MHIHKQYVQTPYGQIHVRTAGKRGKRPSLLLLHQTPSNAIMFERLMRELDDTFWLIAPDLPGFGNSFVPQENPTVQQWADAIFSILPTFSPEPIHLFGHHTGASVALQLATDHPEHVQTLILSGPPLLTNADKDRLRTTLPKHGPDLAGDFLLDAWNRVRSKDPGAPIVLSLRETIAALQMNGRYHAAYEAVFAHNFKHQLTQITCPTLLMAGTQDSLCHSLEPAHALAPNSTIYIIPNASTYLCDRHPEKVSKLITTFIKKTPT
ncbi:MAG: alpha/beta hydrolase [Chloroflexi bacterium]|nr:alpha/beta hydrolase [Chloroflexota bacterium]